MSTETHEHDVLVIGAGGAGLSAAISASEQGADVAVVSKTLLGKAHTVMAEGGIAASLGNVDEEDNWKAHFKDTLAGGWGVSDWKMAEIHAKEAADAVRQLERWGALFDRTDEGKISQRPFGGHRNARLAHVGDRTGLEMIRTLQDKCVEEGIDTYMECTITHLIKDEAEEKMAGAFGFWSEDGESILFRAKNIVLATGGIGKAYRITSNSWEYTGDGHAMALRAGAELCDMEFVQFHPTGMVWPESVKGVLVTEGVRGEGGILKNSEGERFMFNHIPEAYQGRYADTLKEANAWVEDKDNNRPPPELLTRDVVARAILEEVKAGRGSEHGGAYLDIASRRSDDFILEKLPGMYHQFDELADVDITEEPMEVAPTCHYMMGGIYVDPERQESSVDGLYAAGEAAGGLHGANRLGGNSLSDLLVFGNRAGNAAGQDAIEREELPSLNEQQLEAAKKDIEFPFENDDEDGLNPFHLHEELQSIMEEHVGIIRDEERLDEGISKLNELKQKAKKMAASGARAFNAGWRECFDVRNLIDVGLAIANSAKERKESRGAHSRIDYTEPEDQFDRTKVIIRALDDQLETERKELPEMDEELQDLVNQDKK